MPGFGKNMLDFGKTKSRHYIESNLENFGQAVSKSLSDGKQALKVAKAYDPLDRGTQG